MRLVKFDKTRNKSVYVNPEQVRMVIPHNAEKTLIQFNQTMVFVLHDVDYVVRKLTEEQ